MGNGKYAALVSIWATCILETYYHSVCIILRITVIIKLSSREKKVFHFNAVRSKINVLEKRERYVSLLIKCM